MNLLEAINDIKEEQLGLFKVNINLSGDVIQIVGYFTKTDGSTYARSDKYNTIAGSSDDNDEAAKIKAISRLIKSIQFHLLTNKDLYQNDSEAKKLINLLEKNKVHEDLLIGDSKNIPYFEETLSKNGEGLTVTSKYMGATRDLSIIEELESESIASKTKNSFEDNIKITIESSNKLSNSYNAELSLSH
jgi:virulence-associated protein VapD